MKLVKTEQTFDTAASAVGPWVSPDGAVVAVLAGAAIGRELKVPGNVGHTLRVGKASGNDLVLPDATVSRHHMELVRTAQGLVARDLDSRNGTFIGGTRIREAHVEAGTLLLVGDVKLLVRVDIEGALVPPSSATSFGLAIGRGIGMRRLFGLLERIAPSEASVLLIGETGTGKDILARSVHAASARAGGPFEVVDCAAIAANLIESELFGHELGAFTGAVSSHVGAFERARGGTVFLDEIGELPLDLQPKLLRVLEARQIRRVGGKRQIDIDVRVIAATTRDLAGEVEAAGFRRDLYYRLAVVTARVPPLCERPEDIALIAEHMLRDFGGALSLPSDALAQLKSHPWPGNVRELRNVLERASILARAAGATTLLNLGLSAERPVPREEAEPPVSFAEGTTYGEARERAEHLFERQFVLWLLARHDSIAAAARAAKMDRKYLGELVRKHGLAPPGPAPSRK
jgi:transcriptional regulator with GAF, ATPase, and Fis domain